MHRSRQSLPIRPLRRLHLWDQLDPRRLWHRSIQLDLLLQRSLRRRLDRWDRLDQLDLLRQRSPSRHSRRLARLNLCRLQLPLDRWDPCCLLLQRHLWHPSDPLNRSDLSRQLGRLDLLGQWSRLRL
jgi:hypothetical protein